MFKSTHSGDETYLYVNKTTIKFKALDNTPPYYFCLGSVTNNEMSDISLKGTNKYDISTDHVFIGKENKYT